MSWSAGPSSAEFGIPDFIARVAEASDRSAAGSCYSGLREDIASLHEDAGRLLQALVDRKGVDYVARMFH